MTFENACITAYELLKEDDFIGFFMVVDIGNKWVFFGGDPNKAYYGVRTVSVEKGTGKCDWFIVERGENDKLLSEGLKIDFPEEFKYKTSASNSIGTLQ